VTLRFYCRRGRPGGSSPKSCAPAATSGSMRRPRAALSLCKFKPGTMDGSRTDDGRLQYVWKLE